MRVASHEEFEPIDLGPNDRLFVLTGAGISAESGIQTFRDAGGLWEKFAVEDVASPEGLARDPALVWRFYSDRRAQAMSCKPNAAHFALAALAARDKMGDRLYLCTQNVDPLHERAGHERVVHMHGELLKSRCEDPECARAPFYDEREYRDALPRCACGARIRPDIVWFGEVPFDLDAIGERLMACNVFMTVGSSGAVYPAAGFVRAARAAGARTIYVGPERPGNAGAFDECRLGKAGEVLPRALRYSER